MKCLLSRLSRQAPGLGPAHSGVLAGMAALPFRVLLAQRAGSHPIG